jgi:hypothetical protein
MNDAVTGKVLYKGMSTEKPPLRLDADSLCLDGPELAPHCLRALGRKRLRHLEIQLIRFGMRRM